ncbi:SDR family oxidoreductase [Putridiphycobacter roseus]|uniref:SDR family oxidoreductase n=1 Tax=Putridiphycobacter roseus TaxID=2219161 RepID=UPI002936E15E|nr:SDR family oxidoreductase [Putridiphycobacter roseus]
MAGATGKTGKKIVNLLKASEAYEPIAMVRNQTQEAEFKSQGINTRVGDLEGDIDRIAENVSKVIFAAGSGGEKVYDVDQEGAKKLIDASKRAKIDKFVMLSSMGADSPENATQLKAYLQAKHNADEYLSASLLAYSILRPGTLTNNAGTGLIQANSQMEQAGEISRDDVAKTLVALLDMNVARDKSLEILSGETQIGEALKSI